LGMTESQLTFTPSFFRGVGSTTNQPCLTWNSESLLICWV
jgi:hypothetical protein